jgi:hypothetical protein
MREEEGGWVEPDKSRSMNSESPFWFMGTCRAAEATCLNVHVLGEFQSGFMSMDDSLERRSWVDACHRRARCRWVMDSDPGVG